MKLIKFLLLLAVGNYLQAMEQAPAIPASVQKIVNFNALADLASAAVAAIPKTETPKGKKREYVFVEGKQLTPVSFNKRSPGIHTNNQPEEQKHPAQQPYKHVMIHAGSTSKGIRYLCNYGDCSFLFRSYVDAHHHICTHLGIKPYKCPALNCKTACTAKGNLVRHIKNNHKDQPNLQASDPSKRDSDELYEKTSRYIKKEESNLFKEVRLT